MELHRRGGEGRGSTRAELFCAPQPISFVPFQAGSKNKRSPSTHKTLRGFRRQMHCSPKVVTRPIPGAEQVSAPGLLCLRECPHGLLR